jgi:hypothetical protein
MLTLEKFVFEDDNKIQRNNINVGAMVKRREVTKRREKI